MSSNTLRGIGQEEDGDSNATASGKGVAKTPAAAGAATDGTAVVETTAAGDTVPTAGDLTERVPAPQKRASLDSSVPDARSSLDGKVPHLAATLMGVMAPPMTSGNRENPENRGNRENREKGTVHGRDVHLPAESPGRGGVRTAADDVAVPGSGATPHLIEHSEPTRADPVRTAVLVQEANDRAGTSRGGQTRAIDSNSHGPWYDQDPTGGHEVYEDEKPSVVGRAAIGVAMAAGLSVVVFAVLRMSANGEDGDRRPPPAVYEPSSPSGRPASPAPTSSAATAATHIPDGKPSPAATDPGPNADPTEAPSAIGGSARPHDPTRSAKPAAAAAPSAGATGRPTVLRVGPAGARPGARAATPVRAGTADDLSRVGSSAPGGAVISAPAPSHMAAGTAASSPSFAPSDVAVPAPLPPASKPAAPAGSEKGRGKSYDPDSTLPLNLD